MKSTKSNINILYIDDELHNLNAFKASFRKNYIIHIASTIEEGLSILANNKINIIIADQKMPNMTGVQFFEYIRKSYPNPVRILLTGYADIDAVIDAINKGQVYKYLSKPWDVQYVHDTIKEAYQKYLKKHKQNNLIKDISKNKTAKQTQLANKLHEGLLQQLTGIRFYLESINSLGNNTNNEISDIVNKSKSILDDAFIDIQNICFELMPNGLKQISLYHALKELATKVKKEFNFQLNITSKSDLDFLKKERVIFIYKSISELVRTFCIDKGENDFMGILLNTDDNNIIIELSCPINKTIDFDTNPLINEIIAEVNAYDGNIELQKEKNYTCLLLKFKKY